MFTQGTLQESALHATLLVTVSSEADFVAENAQHIGEASMSVYLQF
jgi:translation elongation factor EF-Ts